MTISVISESTLHLILFVCDNLAYMQVHGMVANITCTLNKYKKKAFFLYFSFENWTLQNTPYTALWNTGFWSTIIAMLCIRLALLSSQTQLAPSCVSFNQCVEANIHLATVLYIVADFFSFFLVRMKIRSPLMGMENIWDMKGKNIFRCLCIPSKKFLFSSHLIFWWYTGTFLFYQFKLKSMFDVYLASNCVISEIVYSQPIIITRIINIIVYIHILLLILVCPFPF